MGICFPADPNQELPLCRRASEEKQDINWQEHGVGKDRNDKQPVSKV